MRNNFVMEIKRSDRKGKKYMVEVDGKTIHFGAEGYRIKPGTPAGDNYCSRSLGIVGYNDKSTPNYWARQLWSCKGAKSISDQPFFGEIDLP